MRAAETRASRPVAFGQRCGGSLTIRRSADRKPQWWAVCLNTHFAQSTDRLVLSRRTRSRPFQPPLQMLAPLVRSDEVILAYRSKLQYSKCWVGRFASPGFLDDEPAETTGFPSGLSGFRWNGKLSEQHRLAVDLNLLGISFGPSPTRRSDGSPVLLGRPSLLFV